MRRRAGLAALLALVIALPAWSAAPDAFEQCRKLGRGVNVIGYDPLWRDMSRARFKAEHFKLIHEAGFTHIRIPLHPFRDSRGPITDEYLKTLDWALDEALKNKLMVILDFHEYTEMAKDPEAKKERFLAAWAKLAEHCKDRPDEVLFEILNEPNGKLTPQLWNEFLAAGLKVIRESNPGRTVVIGPAFWNNINHLAELKLPDGDRNIIATIHYYSPMSFTHQGAAWTSQRDKLGVKWTGTEAEKQAIVKDFDKAQAWAREHNRPVYLGEFGAYDKGDMPSRVRWTSFVAREAERRGWSWGYWQFDGDFIVYDIRNHRWIEPIRDALIPPPYEKVLLWPGNAPVGEGKSEAAWPTISVHLPPREKANGAALVICPGGGYGGLVTGAEGHGIAKWANEHGIAGFVLEYRLPNGRAMVPLSDAQQAIRVVREHAKEWNIDPKRVGIIGFSAGGHLAATAETHFNSTDRPDFAILIYPVITMGELGHGGSRENLLGHEPGDKLVELFSNEKQVTDQTPPTFLAHAGDDTVVSPENSRMMYEALVAHHVPAQYLKLESGGHGLNGYRGPSWDLWQAQSLLWLAGLQIIPQADAQTKVGEFDGQSDVGEVQHAGSTERADGKYRVSGSGANIWGTADAFHFVWKKMAGDASIQASISLAGEGGDAHRKGCLMVRKDLSADSAYVDIAVHGDGLISLQYRKTKGEKTQEIQAKTRNPAPVRLERHGNQFVAVVGEEKLGPVEVELADEVYVGLAVSAHNAAATETAVFEGVKVEKK